MKKYAFALALALLFVLQTALAEDVEFSVRGGIKWGMSKDEVLAIEAGNYFDNGADAEEDEDGEKRKQFIEDVMENGHQAFGNGAELINPDSGEGLTLLRAYEARVSGYKAVLTFAFRDDELVCVMYGFGSCDPADYLRAALETKYGEFTDDGYAEFEEAMMYIGGCDMVDMYRDTKESEHKLLENGTYIHSVLVEGAYGIMYQDMNAPWDEIVYDQYGL